VIIPSFKAKVKKKKKKGQEKRSDFTELTLKVRAKVLGRIWSL
jgi:hypothetical protein